MIIMGRFQPHSAQNTKQVSQSRKGCGDDMLNYGMGGFQPCNECSESRTRCGDDMRFGYGCRWQDRSVENLPCSPSRHLKVMCSFNLCCSFNLKARVTYRISTPSLHLNVGNPFSSHSTLQTRHARCSSLLRWVWTSALQHFVQCGSLVSYVRYFSNTTSPTQMC